jgi:signal transduction histidine kinase
LGDTGNVVLRVKDSGPGIPRENQAKLFEPFFTTKPGGKGTGLGLSVSFGIIEDHGGTIRIESEVGHGATFKIELPAMSRIAKTAGQESEGVLVGVS